MSINAKPKTRRQKVEEKERLILEAARKAFVEHGYDGARMADIARASGIAEGTIYLYYKTKGDLLLAFVEDFWNQLTSQASEAVASEDETFAALRALAVFHIESLIDQFDVIRLTQSDRVFPQNSSENTQYMRLYVSVFDRIWSRGVDRGHLSETVPIWIARDHFFGHLEYSARSILLNMQRRSEDVVETLIGIFKTVYGHQGFETSTEAEPSNETQLNRLEGLINRMEALISPE